MDAGKFTYHGTKISPTKNYYVELYKSAEETYTFCVKTMEGLEFYRPLETDGTLYSLDQLDWAKSKDMLFFSTEYQKRIFLFDLDHFQLYSKEVSKTHTIWWADDEERWHVQERLFSSGGKDYFSTVDLLEPQDPMANAPEHKIVDIPDSDYCLWLQQYTVHTYDRKVWKIAVFSKSRFELVMEDLGYYAIEDSLRVGKNMYYNFYGFNAKDSALCVVNFRPEEKFELFIWECPPQVPMRMEWVEEEGFWRAVINHTLIRPKPFYYDNLYSVRVKMTSKSISIPLELANLVAKEMPELQSQRDRIEAESRQAAISRHAEENTSSEDLIRRASGETQFFQRLKAKRFLAHREKPSRRPVISFVAATVLIIAIPTAVAFASANGWRLGGTAMRNIVTTLVMLLTLWFVLLREFIDYWRKKR